MEGTYTLAPGADPASIKWRYSGAEKPGLDDADSLHLRVKASANGTVDETRLPEVTEQKPMAWQIIGGAQVAVSCHYAIHADGSVGFALGEYDHTSPLTIDPYISYSTYLGGFYGDAARGVTLDSAGNIYVVGVTSSTDFPMQGPYQPVFGGGGDDAFITKLSADGSTLLYSTFLGGGPGPEGTGATAPLSPKLMQSATS